MLAAPLGLLGAALLIGCSGDPSPLDADTSDDADMPTDADADAETPFDADAETTPDADAETTPDADAETTPDADADNPQEACGDGTCAVELEDSATCGEDCFCGDGACHPAEETRSTCPLDCGPTFDRLDWLVQDRVTADPTQDPYCAPHAQREEQGAFDPVHFVRLDRANRQNFTSFRVRAFHDQTRWTDRAMTTFDMPPHAESERLASGPFGAWGGDTAESEGPLVSIVGTNDSRGTMGWFNNTGAHGCSYGDAWVLYDETNVPTSPGDGVVTWSEELRTPITGVEEPSPSSCPDALGTSRTRWTFYPHFTYSASAECTGEAHKRMDTIIADHGSGALDHHEVFYMTDEYGLTRWERWNCFDTPQTRPDPDYAATRCDYENTESAMHMAYAVPETPEQMWQIRNREGRYCVLVDCRDATHLVAIPDPGGWLPAGWPVGAQVYAASNLLADGDFAWSDVGAPSSVWSTQGTMSATIESAEDGNHHAILQTTSEGQGWFSQTADASTFYAALGAGRATAGPLRIRYGVRARLESGSSRSLEIAIVQWDDALGVNLDTHVHSVDVTSAYQHFVGEVPLVEGAARVQIRFSLEAGPGPAVWIDDAFELISD